MVNVDGKLYPVRRCWQGDVSAVAAGGPETHRECAPGLMSLVMSSSAGCRGSVHAAPVHHSGSLTLPLIGYLFSLPHDRPMPDEAWFRYSLAELVQRF